MLYRRKEPFRFHFQPPLHGTFKIISIDGKNYIDTKIGALQIIDLSPNGLSFSTKLNLPIDEHKFLLEISLLIDDEMVHMLGIPIWKKEKNPHDIHYGFKGADNNETKSEVIQLLKEYVKKHTKV